MDDYWNVDSCQDLSKPWTHLTQFTILTEKHPNWYTWSRGRLTEVRSKHVEKLSSKRKTAMGWRKAEARQCLKIERHFLHRSGRQRAQGHHEKKFAKKERIIARILHPKQKVFIGAETCSINTDTRRTRYACITKPHESTRSPTGKNSIQRS